MVFATVPERVTLVLNQTRAWDTSGGGRGVARVRLSRQKEAAHGCGGRGSMEFQSIFAWKALPEAGFGKNVVIDAHRCSGSRVDFR